jgi:hypothetical protein
MKSSEAIAIAIKRGLAYSPVRVEGFARRSGETASQPCI